MSNFQPSTNFGRWAYLAMKSGQLARVRKEQEINRFARRGLSRLTSNAWFLMHGMERLHGIGQVKRSKKEMMR